MYKGTATKSDIEKAICSAVENVVRFMLSLPFFPLCLILYIGRTFYNEFFKDPFRISIKDLDKHIIIANEKRKETVKRLREIEEVIKMVESNKMEDNLELLYREKEYLQSLLKPIDSKIMLVNMVKMIRENIDIFYELYGRDNFKKLLNKDTYKKIDEELKKIKAKEIDIESLYNFFIKEFPIMIGELKEKAKEKQQTQATSQHPIPLPQIPVDRVDKLVKYGSVEEWLSLIKEALEKNAKIMFPSMRNYNTEGYRNLLLAMITSDVPLSKLKEVITDRFAYRLIDYLKKLTARETIEISPESSDKDYIDQAIEIICKEHFKEELTETEIIKHYKLSLKDKEMIIERRIIKDPITKKAKRIIYKAL
jgi:hypothetical protein